MHIETFLSFPPSTTEHAIFLAGHTKVFNGLQHSKAFSLTLIPDLHHLQCNDLPTLHWSPPSHVASQTNAPSLLAARVYLPDSLHTESQNTFSI